MKLKKTITAYLLFFLAIASPGYSIQSPLNDVLAKFSRAILAHDIDGLANFLSPVKFGTIVFSDVLRTDWKIDTIEYVSIVVDKLYKGDKVLASVIVHTSSKSYGSEYSTLYWININGRWELCNFPFFGSGIPSEFPFLNQGALQIVALSEQIDKTAK